MFQLNDSFSKATGQFAEVAANVNRLALANAEKAFGLHLAALEENLQATFAFAGELMEARDLDAMKTLWPKGLQVARANVERSLGATQEVIAHTLKTHEELGALAKRQFELASAQFRDEADKPGKAGAKAPK